MLLQHRFYRFFQVLLFVNLVPQVTYSKENRLFDSPVSILSLGILCEIGNTELEELVEVVWSFVFLIGFIAAKIN